MIDLPPIEYHQTIQFPNYQNKDYWILCLQGKYRLRLAGIGESEEEAKQILDCLVEEDDLQLKDNTYFIVKYCFSTDR